MSCNVFAYCENNPVNYVDYSGYWCEEYIGFIKTDKGFNVYVSTEFLSRRFCLSYAEDFLNKYSDGKTWFWQKTYSGMDKKRIAQELWFHALVYYIGTPIKKILKQFNLKGKWLNTFIDKAEYMEINSNDKRQWAYKLTWNMASVIVYRIKQLKRYSKNLGPVKYIVL